MGFGVRGLGFGGRGVGCRVWGEAGAIVSDKSLEVVSWAACMRPNSSLEDLPSICLGTDPQKGSLHLKQSNSHNPGGKSTFGISAFERNLVHLGGGSMGRLDALLHPRRALRQHLHHKNCV